MTERTDQERIRLLKQDDPQAIQDLWELLFTLTVNVERRYRDVDDIANLARDAAIQAYQRIRTRGVYQFEFKCAFPGYCRVILVREALRLIKRQPKQIVELEEEIIGEEDPQPPPSRSRIRTLLQPCLDLLKPRERQVIEHRYMMEETPEEVAGILGITRNYVNVIAKRARDSLRRCLQDRGYATAADVL